MKKVVVLLVAGILFAGCLSPLREGESRVITAWGIWAAPFGTPIGVGYWHSERGPDRLSTAPEKPGLPDGVSR